MTKRNKNLNFVDEAKLEVRKIELGRTDNNRLMNIFSMMTQSELDEYTTWYGCKRNCPCGNPGGI